MRHFLFASPLMAALLLGACSAEDGAENEIEVIDPGTSSENGIASNVSDEESLDAPPPPLPEADGGSNGPDDPVASVIPAPFRGEWNQEQSACGTGASETRLRIGANELRFYESAGEVSEVEVVSDRVVEVTATYSGEGQTWTNERRLSLSPDGETLTVSGDGATMTRSRCP